MMRNFLLLVFSFCLVFYHTHCQITNPGQISGLSLWLRADSGIAASPIQTWSDISGNGWVAAQPLAAKSPTRVNAVATLNNRPVVNFNGAQFLRMLSYTQSQPYTIFGIWNTTATTNTHNLIEGTTASSRVIIRHSGGTLNAFAGATLSYNKSAPFTYTISALVGNGTSSELFENGISRASGDVGNHAISGLTIGARFDTTTATYLIGNIAELIIYNRVLSAAERKQVENYLRHRYAPPVVLGPDTTITNSFCPYTLSAAKPWFSSYSWNTGATSPSISVTQSGTYAVTVTDIFGFQSSDTIIILRSAFDSLKFVPKNRTICLGDSARLSSGLPLSGFTHAWSNGSSSNVIYPKVPANYSLTVTDAFACSAVSDTLTLSVDSLSVLASLGNDSTLCAGNKIGLQKGARPGLSYLWSNGATDSTISVFSNGNYWLQVTNPLGCQARDTIAITISGVAPTVNFSADSVCQGQSTSFTNLSIPLAADSFKWEIAGNVFSTQTSPQHVLASAGVTQVSLTGYLTGCFATITKPVWVYALPPVAITADDSACVGRPIPLKSAASAPPGQILSAWWWQVPTVGVFSSPNLVVSFPSTGNYSIKHAVLTDKGCTDTTTKNIVVVPTTIAPLGTPTLIAPANQSNESGNPVDFRWNSALNAKRYRLQVSQDTAFAAIVLDTVTAGSLLSHPIAPSANDYFWRVIAYNLCGDSVKSAQRSFTVLNASLLSGLSLWLRADSGIAASPVQSWSDISGNGWVAAQPLAAKSPTRVNAVATLNNRPVLNFNGAQFLRMLSYTQSQPYTIFGIWNTTASTNTHNLIEGTTASSRVIIRHSGGTLNAFAGATLSYNKSAPFTYTISALVGNGTSSELFENGISRASGDVGTHAITGLTIGARFDTTTATYLIGNIAELIIYNRVLSAAERKQVENYLRHRYAPPVVLGPDTTISNSFCPYTLSAAKPWFSSYSWNTGATSPSISVTQSGTYAVTVTDIFGFQSSDTIIILRSAFDSLKFVPKNRTICLGDSARLSSGLPLSGFTHAWSNGSSSNVIYPKVPANYSLTVTDAFACSAVSDTLTLSVDSLSVLASLGNDSTLCAGNKIGLQKGNRPGLSFLWSNGATDSTISVFTSGNYWVQVTNSLGCEARDTIAITISGVAPTVNFSADSVCQGQSTSFTNLSIPLAADSFKWEIAGNVFSTQTSPQHVLASAGVTQVSLTGYLTGCFATITKPVWVYALPPVAITADDSACVGRPIPLKSAASAPPGQILSAWWWQVPTVGVFSSPNLVVSFPSTGNYSIKHAVLTDKGCTDTTTKNIVVVPTTIAPLGTPTLIAPANQSNESGNPVDFRWNSALNAKRYRLQVSQDTAFAAIVLDTVTAGSLLSHPIAPSANDYFWRVIAYNLCGDSVKSAQRSFTVLNASLLSGLSLWLRADSGIAASPVQSWSDISGNGWVAAQPLAAKSPTRVNAVATLNNRPVLNFNGAQFLRMLSYTQSQPYTIFGIWNTTATTNTHNLIEGTTASSRVIIRHSGGTLNAFAGATLSYNKSAPFTYTISALVGNGTSSELFENGISRASGDVGTHAITGLTIGARFDTTTATYLIGNIAELIIYNRVLSAAERKQVENYLRHRYAPPVVLGPDTTISNSFCPYTLSAAKPWFSSYSWNTGATSPSISVTQSGTYAVTVTDIFGFQSSDTIIILRSAFDSLKFVPKNRTICLGDSARLSSGLPLSGFTHAWSNGSSSNVIYPKVPANYSLTVTDAFACSAVSDTLTLSVDSLSVLASLGNDSTLCAGNKIGLQKGNRPGLSFLWSNGATTPIIFVFNAGDYSVEVTSPNGCIFKDTITVNIRGIAPFTAFVADTVCKGNPTTFINYSYKSPPDSIVQYIWDFGNNLFSNDTHPIFTFAYAGVYAVKLIAVSSDTCSNDTIQNVIVYELPQAYFEKDTACANRSLLFKDLSVAPTGQTLAGWNWDFGDGNSSNIQHPIHLYSSVGNYNVRLVVETNKQCRDTFDRNLTLLPGAPLPLPFSSYLPADSFYTTSSLVHFKWNESENARNYKLQISKSPNFSILLVDTPTFNHHLLIALSPWDSMYYWRVLAFNVCEDFIACKPKVLSVVNFANSQSNLLWLRSDSLLTLSGSSVISWGDVSGNLNIARQPVASKRPTMTPPLNILNKYRAIQCNGSQFLRLLTNAQNQPLTLFAVWNTTGNSPFNSFLDGTHSGNRIILRHSNSTVNVFAGAVLDYPKTTPFNFILSSVIYNGSNSRLYENTVLRSSGNVGSNTFSGFTIGSGFDTLANNFFIGQTAEILLFNYAMSDLQRRQVEGYLRTKYAPPVSLGPDIKFAYGACDTVLRIQQHFVKVLWSTGDTGVYSIKVRKPGKYWVRTTDVFGFVSSDTVNVSVPYSGISPAKDTIVCAGNSVELKFGINGAPYFFEWSTGDTGTNKITVNQPGSYFVRVSDTIGCQLISDTIRVAVDSLEFFSVLNDDTITCTNSPLGLIPYIYPYKNYQWSTGGNKDTILVPGGGMFYVTVTDVNGCSTTDSIRIKVKGVAPVVDFVFKNKCFGDTTEFTDLSTATAPEQLVGWVWNLGENDTLYDQNPKKVFPFVGSFNVMLTAITDSGCFATKVKPVVIGSRPTPLISYTITCANASTLIADASTIVAGDTIKNWLWTLPNGATYTSKNFSVKFDSAGVYPVKLVVTSAKGCVDSTKTLVEVFPAIRPDFEFDNQCQSKPTLFKDITNSLSIIKRVWKLTNTPGIINDSIQFTKTFFAPDTFEVILEVTNAIGCKDTARKQVVIYPTPTANFIDTAGCMGGTVTLQQNSISVDSITKFEWKFGNRSSKYMAPTFALPDTGKIPVSLKITTAKGCVDSVSKWFSVIPLPKANFTFSPIFGEAPLTVSMLNQSSNAVSYFWDFGNGETSTTKEPSVTYTTNDTFDIRLTAYNALGCADSTVKKMVVIPTDLDIELVNVNIQRIQLSNGNFSTSVMARFANVGTQPILSAQFLATLDKGTTILDNWSGFLFPGEILTHTFSSSFYLPKNSQTQYVCIDAIHVNGGGEKNTANNRNCRSLDNQVVVTPLYPNPATGKIYLDLILPEAEDFTFEICNELGQRLLEDATFRAARGFNQVEFDVRHYLPGIYIFKATYRDNVVIQKFQVPR